MATIEGEDLTLGSVYEEISEGLALARTKALMGERDEAQSLFQSASLEFKRFRPALEDYPGFAALEYAFSVTLDALAGKKPEEKKATGKRRRP